MSKSRNEKKPPAQPIPVPTTNDIIPGKFNENQWNAMVEQESSQDFILDILDEIVESTVQVIHDKYIQSQLQPYSVEAAKDLLLQIIELRFLEHDNGEVCPENDFTWLEDDEPVPCVTDSWAQGSVPVQRCESRPLSARSESRTMTQSHSETDSPELLPSEESKEQDESKNDGEASNGELESTQTDGRDIPLSMEVIPSPPPTSRVLSPGRRQRVAKSTGMKTKRTTRKRNVTTQEKPENQREVKNDVDPSQIKSPKPIHQIRTGRAPAEQEVTYDEHGNIVAMMRLSLDKLPTHRIRPRYHILDTQTDNTLTTPAPRKTTKKDGTWSHLGTKQTPSSFLMKTSEKQTFKSPVYKSSILLETTEQNDDEVVKPLPPPLADSMDISAGVVVREGQLVRKGPELYTNSHEKSQVDILNLQPVGSLAKRQTISVSDVIGNTSPVIRQMRLPDPIPPIAHRS